MKNWENLKQNNEETKELKKEQLKSGSLSRIRFRKRKTLIFRAVGGSFTKYYSDAQQYKCSIMSEITTSMHQLSLQLVLLKKK